MIIDDLSYYGQSYINNDWSMKDHGSYGFNMFPLKLEFKYANLKHSPIQLSMKNFTFDFIQKARDSGKPVVAMQLPLIRDWSFDLDYSATMLLLPLKGHIKIILRETIANVTCEMKVTEEGYLYPKLRSINLDFGNSSLETGKLG